MATEKAGFGEMFRGLKDIAVDHFRDTWSPFKRTCGNNLLKDIFSKQDNIQKLGIRVIHVALGILLGLCALSVAAAAASSISSMVFNVMIGGAVGAFAVGMAFAFFPKQVNELVEKVAAQVQKLRSHL